MLGVCNGENELRLPVRSIPRPPPGFRPVPLTFALRLICMLTALPSYVHEPSRSEQVCSPNGQLVRSTSQNTRYLAGGIQFTVPSDRTTQLVLPYASSWCPSALWKTRRARDVRRSQKLPGGSIGERGRQRFSPRDFFEGELHRGPDDNTGETHREDQRWMVFFFFFGFKLFHL